MPSILWVADTPDWAWAAMGRGCARYAPTGYTIEVVDQRTFGVFTKEQPEALLDYDAVFQCSWPEASTKIRKFLSKSGKRSCTLVASHGIEYLFPQRDPTPVTRIATRLRNLDTARERLPHFDAVLCVNQRLHQLATWINDNSYFTPPGVDTEFFLPDTPRLNENLRVGWCGQRTGVTKGFSERLEPLMDRVRGVTWVINDRSSGTALSRDEMVEWYSTIDVLISTSFSEGCQMPILEAMSCSKPVVATNCGLADHLVRDGHTGFLIENGADDRVIPQIADALYRLAADDTLRVTMGGNARWLVENHYSWAVRAPEWVKAICGVAE